MSRPRLRGLLVGLGVLIAVPVLAMIVGAALVPKEKLAVEIAEQVELATGAQVTPGEASLKVVGGLGLSLNGGRLQGTGAELAKRTGTGQDVERFDIQYSKLKVSLAMLPLLRREVEIKSVRLAGPVADIELADDKIRLNDYDILLTDLTVDLSQGPWPTGEAPGQNLPADLRFDVRGEVAELVQKGMPWQEVHATGEWANKRLEIHSLTAHLADGTVQANGVLDYATDPWGTLSWDARMENLPAGQVLAPYLPDLAEKLSCDLAGNVGGAMKLRDKETRLKTLDLKGDLASGEGVLHAEAWLRDVSHYLGKRQDLKTVNFRQLNHDFAVAEGRYLINTLEIDGLDTDWQASGWLGFTGDLGLRVGVRLPAGFTPDLGGMSFLAETMRDDAGRVNLGLNLSGKLAAPSIGLDLSGLGRKQ